MIGIKQTLAACLLAAVVVGCARAPADPLGRQPGEPATDRLAQAPRVVTATLPPATPLPPTGTPTPSPAPTAVPATPAASLTSSAASVSPGGCVEVRWSVAGARRVRLSGKDVSPRGSREACLATETTFYLWYEGLDGSPGERTLTVKVAAPTSAATAVAAASGGDDAPEPDDPSEESTLEPTPCDTECAVLEPPTEEPRPTRPPRPTAEPTDEPQPTDEPPATDEPRPTDEPEPTDEPDPTSAPPGGRGFPHTL